jgi:cyclophilin family peptidyl-prolyl cis-trans isomerase
VGPTEASSTGSTGTTGSESSTGALPVGCEGDTPRVRLVTNLGDMVVMLDAVNAPITVANFIQYVEADFYAGTIFHRVLDGFVIQGGGFTTDLQEKPTEPPISLEIVPGLTHIDGAIAMARTNVPDSATSQFYICDGPQPFLDGNYAVFGVLIEGFEVRDAISAVQVDGNDTPLEDVIIMSATCE